MKIGGHQLLSRFWKDASGATAIEYGVLIGMIFVIIAAVAGLGGGVQNLFTSVAEKTRLAFNL